MKRVLLCVFVSVFWVECTFADGVTYSMPSFQEVAAGISGDTNKTLDMADTEKVAALLYKHYREWKGVRHKTGGTSKKGVDCSAFIAMAFAQRFNIDLPRSVKAQSKVGTAIEKTQLRPGDLVFFRTRIISKHVGVYMGAGNFMHVSSKKGVMVSALTDYYWAKKYWRARRITVLP